MDKNEVKGLALRTSVLAIFTFALFSCFGTLLKLSREHVSTLFVIWFRFAAGGVLLFIWCSQKHGIMNLIPNTLLKIHASRIILSLCAFWCFAYAAPLLPVSDSVALQFSIPILLAILAKFFLGETISFIRQVAIAFGVLGVLLVAKPSGDGSFYASSIVLLGCAFAAISDIQVKVLARTYAPEVIALYLFMGGFVVFSCTLPWSFQIPNLGVTLYLIGMALAGTSAQVLLGFLFTQMSASAIAPFVYTSFIWSIIFDISIWNNYPDAMGLLGAFCIMLDGLLAYYSIRLEKPAKA